MRMALKMATTAVCWLVFNVEMTGCVQTSLGVSISSETQAAEGASD
jgi:hypothetical protein